jgi:hypothetical protein
MVTGDIIMTSDRQHHLAPVALLRQQTWLSPAFINKIDLVPLVGANLKIMEADALRMRVKRPFIFTNLKSGEGVDQIASFVIEKGGLEKSSS